MLVTEVMTAPPTPSTSAPHRTDTGSGAASIMPLPCRRSVLLYPTERIPLRPAQVLLQTVQPVAPMQPLAEIVTPD
jgi:hypothetical protein